MPRREYSDAAIASRKRIIDKAYETLLEFHQKVHVPPVADVIAEPNANLSASSTTETTSDRGMLPPKIEADEKDFAGLLLILYELGESERVLNITRPYYDPEEAEYQSARISPHDPDLLLSVCLSYLDIGRESWKQGQYENAAISLESAQDILLREGLFLSIRSEIQSDLFRLRPYRILELLSASYNQAEQHRRGMALLQEMLDARRGIDGSGNDYSGLGIDDFLRFIQQLRSYMTALAQQTLFEEEARRPSSVATYLAVYALIARGFSQRQPALIRRAKGLLVKLSAKQDIYLEKAVCALLLGQTEEASTAIDNSSEDDQIAFIRQNSEGAPDLLPGLCMYSERWLQEEVYPHFRDLMNQIVSLKDYFADEQVQAYLEELPNTGAMSSEWTAPVGGASLLDETISLRRNFGNDVVDSSPETKLSEYRPEPPTRFQRSASAVPVMERPESVYQSQNNGYVPKDLPRSPRSRSFNDSVKEVRRTPPVAAKTPPKRKFNMGRLVLVMVLAIAILGGAIASVVWAFRSLLGPRPQAFIQMQKPIATLTQSLQTPTPLVLAQTGPITKEIAPKIIETWQTSKAKALGNSYEDNLLEEILTDPALSDWRGRSRELKASNSYLQYQTKSITIEQVIPDGDTKAKIIAKISESRNFFNNGELDRNASAEDANYTVEYDLVRQDDRWLIREMLVL
jgi:flagellin-specific chaperone FliS